MSNKPTNKKNKSLITPSELAILLKISKVTVYRLVENGQIPCYRLRGGLRFNQCDIDNFLNKKYCNTTKN
jgi:excisionase family DNA binding protein